MSRAADAMHGLPRLRHGTAGHDAARVAHQVRADAGGFAPSRWTPSDSAQEQVPDVENSSSLRADVPAPAALT